jgi:hypothetical protein
MNREILFRAKYQQSEDINDTIWVYGNLCLDSRLYRRSLPAIQSIPPKEDIYQGKIVYIIHHPKTIGQFTGFIDKNGVKIFEGDLVCDKDRNVGEVIFDDGEFQIKPIKCEECIWHNTFYDSEGSRFSWNDLEVIGNIHDKKD